MVPFRSRNANGPVHDQQRFTDVIETEEITRLLYFLDAADAKPVPGKQFTAFDLRLQGIGIKCAGE